MEQKWNRILPTVFCWESGEKERLLPQDILGSREKEKCLKELEETELPGQLLDSVGEIRRDGALFMFPVYPTERFYGLGLQMYSFLQNGKRKRLTTNADAPADTGDSHAPVPFFVSSQGYGILVDSAQTVEVDFGCSIKCGQKGRDEEYEKSNSADTAELYQEEQRGRELTIFVRGASRLRLYCFAGGTIKKAVEQYNLFCGGGCLPPLWGLGNLYRCYTKADQKQVEKILEQFAEEKMPFSMVGLEPGWQSHSYSSSLVFGSDFPHPEQLFKTAKEKGVKINLWEQAYIHPSSPVYQDIKPYSGEYGIWNGVVPDFATKQACEIFGAHQRRLISDGAAAVKLDECDGSDYTGNWFFPDYTRFPSGLTGEEEKNLYGAMAVRAIWKIFLQEDKRTWSQVRANYSHGAPVPFVLYSDLYDHRQFVRALCNAGFCGLLWSPEVRQSHSEEELIRRIQTVIFSPLSIINAWMVPNPPWKQFNIEKNRNNDLLMDDSLQKKVRKLLLLRNRLVPYLYTAFFRYEKDGTPPFRPVVMDYPQDERFWENDDCYMMGDSLLVAPLMSGAGTEEKGRNVCLPQGRWFEFWTGDCYEGGRSYWLETENIPVFVKENSILPLAEETDMPGKDTVFHLEVRLYGKDPKTFCLLEDDGESFAYARGGQRQIFISKSDNEWQIPDSYRYQIVRTVFYPSFSG